MQDSGYTAGYKEKESKENRTGWCILYIRGWSQQGKDTTGLRLKLIWLHKQLYIKYYLKEKIEDIFGKKTYAESQRDKYKKVVRNLEKELKKTDNLSDVMAQLATDYNIMEMNSDSAQGKLSDTFVTKESENCEAVEKLGADFKEIIAEVKLKLEFARKAEIFMAGWSFFDSDTRNFNAVGTVYLMRIKGVNYSEKICQHNYFYIYYSNISINGS